MSTKRKTFEAGQVVEFQVETWEAWQRGTYEGKVDEMRGHHYVGHPGKTKILDLSAYGHGMVKVPARWIIPTRRVRAIAEEADL